MAQTHNPLQQYFRQPVLHLRLPNNGQFWPQGSLELPPNNELPVLPMTAIDEITYRTPDAVFNGSAIVSVIQSCIPGVKNAWMAPGTDLNAMLIAIRIASFGNEMEIDTTCPSCNHVGEYSISLNSIMVNMPKPDYTKTIKHNDLEIYFRPLDYKTQNQINLAQFEQQKILMNLSESTEPEEQKMKTLNAALEKITQLTLAAIQRGVAGIRTPQGIVTDPDHIQEFLVNCDRNLFNEIKDKAIELRTETELKPMKIECSECKHEYEQAISLDNVSFFEIAS
jgi:hypothetical protein